MHWIRYKLILIDIKLHDSRESDVGLFACSDIFSRSVLSDRSLYNWTLAEARLRKVRQNIGLPVRQLSADSPYLVR
jgi:hypothetical protein